MFNPDTYVIEDAVAEILHRDGLMSLADARLLGNAVAGAGREQLEHWLLGLATDRGTPNEAKLAAAVLGLMNARDRDQECEEEEGCI